MHISCLHSALQAVAMNHWQTKIASVSIPDLMIPNNDGDARVNVYLCLMLGDGVPLSLCCCSGCLPGVRCHLGLDDVAHSPPSLTHQLMHMDTHTQPSQHPIWVMRPRHQVVVLAVLGS